MPQVFDVRNQNNIQYEIPEHNPNLPFAPPPPPRAHPWMDRATLVRDKIVYTAFGVVGLNIFGHLGTFYHQTGKFPFWEVLLVMIL